MAFVTPKTILEDGYRHHYAVGAFAIHNLEIIRGVIEAAEAKKMPVILQTTPGTVNYLGVQQVSGMVQTAAENSTVPVALHLDHGDQFSTIICCLRAGYSSIMIDASELPYEENVQYVQKVVEAAHAVDVPVEAELGTVGRADKEVKEDEAASGLTDPAAAEAFVERTNIDSLAPAFGTAHGHYANKPVLDFARLRDISNRIQRPVVMHGASGISDEDLRKAIQGGVSKINFSTELKTAFVDELQRFLNDNPEQRDPRKYFVTAREQVTEIAKHKMDILQSARTKV